MRSRTCTMSQHGTVLPVLKPHFCHPSDSPPLTWTCSQIGGVMQELVDSRLGMVVSKSTLAILKACNFFTEKPWGKLWNQLSMMF